MKNLFKILMLLCVIIVFNSCASQRDYERHIVNVGADPGILINGAYEYNDTPVLHAHLSLTTSHTNGNELGMYVSYANLQPYNYFDMGFLYNRRFDVLKTEKIETLIGITGGLIARSYPDYETKKVYPDVGINAELRWWITPWLGVYTKGSGGPRWDLNFYGPHQFIHFDVEGGLVASF